MLQVVQQTECERTTADARLQVAAGLLLASFFVGGQIALWSGQAWARNTALVGVTLIVALGLALFPPRRQLQSRSVGNQWMGWLWALVGSAAIVLLLALTAMATGIWRPSDGYWTTRYPPLEWLTVKIPTVIVQQIVLLFFVVPIIESWFRRPTAVSLFGASIFAALHFPNPILMVLTWMGGFLWIQFFAYFRQWLPVVVSHVGLALALSVFGGEYVLNMRVGMDCVRLLPSVLNTNRGPIRVLPNAVTGQIHSVRQSKGMVAVAGTATAWHTSRRPADFCLLNYVESGEHTQCKLVEVSETKYDRDAFELLIPWTEELAQGRWKVMAQNHEGWWAELGDIGSLIPASRVPTGIIVQLIPREIDGRCESFQRIDEGLSVSGWVVDLDAPSSPLQLGYCCGQEQGSVPLSHRTYRGDIAEAYHCEETAQSGFSVKLCNAELGNGSRADFYAIDSNGDWHPLSRLTDAEQIQAESGR